MANNNIEQYLEAMLAALDGETVPDVPSPSWNIEKYLAAILTKLSSGGGSGGGGDVVVSHITRDTVDGETVYTCDMTKEEIESAKNDGKTVLCQLYDVVSVFGTASNKVSFVKIGVMNNTLTYINVLFGDDGITVVPKNYTLTPAT